MRHNQSRGKLVRHKIPSIIQQAGELPIWGICEDMRQKLCDKLVEETWELWEVNDKNVRPAILVEFADVKEVLDELYHERRLIMAPLPLTHARPFKDMRRELYDCARLVRRSIGAIGCIEGFCELFAKTLDHYHFNEHQLAHAQERKRAERGGFRQRTVLFKVICPEQVMQLS